jgi:phosphohistidine phosphatase
VKQLLIMRHAKAQADSEDGSDRSRPLAPRGERNAAAMGRCLHRADLDPQLILSSPALRARQTAQLVAEQTGHPGEVELHESIYEASADALMSVLRAVPEPAARVLLVGHNPSLERLVWSLCRASHSVPWAGLRLPTGTVVLVELGLDLWPRLEPGAGRIEWSLTPRLVLAINPKLEA